AAGGNHSLALKSDGTVWAWGYNNYGQLGDGTTGNKTTPITVEGVGGPGELADVAAVAACEDRGVALESDGSGGAGGVNDGGQLGDGTPADRHTPVRGGGLTDVVAVAAGWQHSIALKSDGTVWAWGWNAYGQLGDGTTGITAYKTTPVQVKGPGGNGYLTDVVAVAAGYQHSLALKSDGTVWAWGWNDSGRLGDGTTTDRSTPVQVKGPGGNGYLTDVIAVAAGHNHSLAIKSDGTVWAWGR